MMAGKEFPCVDEGFEKNEVVDVVVRPEDIMVVGTDVGMLEGVVESVLFKGVHYEMMVATGETRWKVHSTAMQPVGSRVGLSIVPFKSTSCAGGRHPALCRRGRRGMKPPLVRDPPTPCGC